MLRSIKIRNFRCFKSFELQQLGRVNLFVGTNNSGKTSILEATQLLCSRANLEPLREILIKRGEYLWDDEAVGSRELDIRHLFFGHELTPGNEFSIVGANDRTREELLVSVAESSTQLSLFENVRELDLSIHWLLGEEREAAKLPLSPNDGLFIDSGRRLRKEPKNSFIKTQFVTSSLLTGEKLAELFDQVSLTPEEETVIEVLKSIEPNIERIAAVTSKKYKSSGIRSGFIVRLSESQQRIPLGSMGDGIWRMLGLTLAIVNAKGGVLLIDEIDTGLHFSAMSDMWKMIWKTAQRLDVQVFATTHSRDCWESLAEVGRMQEAENEITIHRIERGHDRSVVFSGRKLLIAADQEIEVR